MRRRVCAASFARKNGVVAKRSNAAGCKPAGLAPSEVRILPAPPIGAFAREVAAKRQPYWTVMSGSSSVGRASAFQAEGRGSESRLPLHPWNGSALAHGGAEPVSVPERPRGSVVEHFLGKEGVTGSIPVVGSSCLVSCRFIQTAAPGPTSRNASAEGLSAFDSEYRSNDRCRKRNLIERSRT